MRKKNKFLITAAIMAVVIAGCCYAVSLFFRPPPGVHSGPPELALGQNIQGGIKDDNPQAQLWTKILTRDFPPGSSAPDMMALLGEQGFHVNRGRQAAYYEYGGAFCNVHISVYWTQDSSQRIITLKGGSFTTCL